MRRAALSVLLMMGFTSAAVAEDSVVLGRGIGNEYVGDVPCPEGSLCMDSLFVWTLQARKTIAGPAVEGTVRASAVQHTYATEKYVRSVELFVLRPIEDAAERKRCGADFHLVDSSPRYDGGKYCLFVDPRETGLMSQDSKVEFDSDIEAYCFDRKLLK